MSKNGITVLLASPRGFCAGVDRAVQIVERALEKYGAPVYVRHEIVHNKYVVNSLRDKGAVFVEKLSEIPNDGQPVIFSAHGVPKRVPEEAKRREMLFVDATCPLVSKVHREAERHFKNGRKVILIGHAGHPEVIGTMGQLPEGEVVLVETIEDVESLDMDDGSNIAWCSQTTLSVDETAGIVRALEKKFPDIAGPHKEDICYATTNRQSAVKSIAPKSDALIVIGAPNSSNSRRLVEIAKTYGCEKSLLIERAEDINIDSFSSIKILGLTAGASAPELLVEEVIDLLREHFEVKVEEISIKDENIIFKLPKILAA
jgi:4-hydroxy-3-methylbut-2-enyl diphosphate reductase